MAFAKLARKSEIPQGESRVVAADGGTPVALFNVAGEIYATDNRCRHRGGPLGEGILSGCHVICPWHFWKFDVRTGQQAEDPSIAVPCFPVKVEGDDVWVDVTNQG
jgi:NAD(P)H-dependent nitrite reductase small subunit